MTGYQNDHGLQPRIFQNLFQSIRQQNYYFKITCSYLEIYNEKINDLLNEKNLDLRIREDPKLGVYVQNLTEVEVGNS
jgi:kinesin family member 15